jgi:hypothetical protein
MMAAFRMNSTARWPICQRSNGESARLSDKSLKALQYRIAATIRKRPLRWRRRIHRRDNSDAAVRAPSEASGQGGAVCADFIEKQGVFRPPQRPATRSGDDQHDHAVKNEHLQSGGCCRPQEHCGDDGPAMAADRPSHPDTIMHHNTTQTTAPDGRTAKTACHAGNPASRITSLAAPAAMVPDVAKSNASGRPFHRRDGLSPPANPRQTPKGSGTMNSIAACFSSVAESPGMSANPTKPMCMPAMALPNGLSAIDRRIFPRSDDRSDPVEKGSSSVRPAGRPAASASGRRPPPKRPAVLKRPWTCPAVCPAAIRCGSDAPPDRRRNHRIRWPGTTVPAAK